MPDTTTFDVFATIAGTTYPEDTVPVYTDQKSAYEAHKLELKIADTKDADEVDKLDKQRREFIERVKSSELQIKMRGVPGPVRDAIREKVEQEYTDENERNEAFTYALLAAHVLEIKNAQGAVDSRAWDGDLIKSFLQGVPDENSARVVEKLNDLTLRAAYFEEVEVSADFS